MVNKELVEKNDLTSISYYEIKEILNKTDWQKYWDDVMKDSEREIEAYRKAEAMSRKSNQKIWNLYL